MKRRLFLVVVLAFGVGCSDSGSPAADASTDAASTDGGLDATASDAGGDAGLDAAVDAEADAEPAPVCGNGVVEPDEVCDDGNTDDGDLCDGDCQTSHVCDDNTPEHATLEDALADAACRGIRLESDRYVRTEPLSLVDRDVVILGSGSNRTTLVARTGRVMEIDGGKVTLRDLAVSGGSARRGGGILSFADELVLEGVLVSDNEATHTEETCGGGIYQRGGRLLLRDTTVENNSIGSPGRGAGVCVENATAVIVEQASQIRNNTIDVTNAPATGGGMYVVGQMGSPTTVRIDGGSSLDGNVVTVQADAHVNASGGGLYAEYANVTVDQATITGNQVINDDVVGTNPNSGSAGLDIRYGQITLHGATVSNNEARAQTSVLGNNAVASSGAVFCAAGTLTIDQGTVIEGNVVAATASSLAPRAEGAAVGLFDCAFEAHESFIRSNEATATSVYAGQPSIEGGIIECTATSPLAAHLERTVVSGNTARAEKMSAAGSSQVEVHGGLFSGQGPCAIEWVDGSIVDNDVRAVVSASGAAGTTLVTGGLAVVGQDTSLTIDGCTVAGNTVRAETSTDVSTSILGGLFAVDTFPSTFGLRARNSTFSGNRAVAVAGGGDTASVVRGGVAHLAYDGLDPAQFLSCTFEGNAIEAATAEAPVLWVAVGVSPSLANDVFGFHSAAPGATPPGADACIGPATATGPNLFMAGGCAFTGPGTITTDTDPLLEPLADNGGPTTTHALGAGSPAIDAGDPAGCTDGEGGTLDVDQRGQPRNGTCDLGAFEVQP